MAGGCRMIRSPFGRGSEKPEPSQPLVVESSTPSLTPDMPISSLIMSMEEEKHRLIEQMQVQNELVVELSNMIRGDRNITFMSDDTTEEEKRVADTKTLAEQAVVLDILGSMQEKVNRMESERDRLFKTISKYEAKMKELELQNQAHSIKISALEHVVECSGQSSSSGEDSRGGI